MLLNCFVKRLAAAALCIAAGTDIIIACIFTYYLQIGRSGIKRYAGVLNFDPPEMP